MFRNDRIGTVVGGIGIFVLFCIVIAFLTPKSPPEPNKAMPPDPFQNPKAGGDHVRELAMKYGTDFDKLSEDDKVFLNSIAMGHGRDLLKKAVEDLKRNPPPSKAKAP